MTDRDLYIYTRTYASGTPVDAPTLFAADDVTIQLAEVAEVVIRRRDGGVNTLKLMKGVESPYPHDGDQEWMRAAPDSKRWDVV